MTPRTFVTFEADFPEDWEWDPKGNLVVPGGLGVARAIVSAIRSTGSSATEPVQHSFYGWSFEFASGSVAVWSVLQYPGPWLLQVEPRRKGLARLVKWSFPADFERVLETLHGLLSADRRFSRLQWFTRNEYESGRQKGFDTPCER